MKNAIKSKKFWFLLSGTVILLLQAMGLKVDVPVVDELISSLCAVLMFMGIITRDVDAKCSVTDVTGDNGTPDQSDGE